MPPARGNGRRLAQRGFLVVGYETSHAATDSGVSRLSAGRVVGPTFRTAERRGSVIRTSMRECLETWGLQAQDGPVTVEALETILARATVPILRQVEERPPELVVALLPSLICTILTAFVEVMAEQQASKA